MAAQQASPAAAGEDPLPSAPSRESDPAPVGRSGGGLEPGTAPGRVSEAVENGAAPSIAEMRVEIDAIDGELVRLIRRRTALSNAIGAARQSQGGTRIVYSREMQVLERFRELGPAGTELGMLLLSLGRGTLGRK